MSRKSRPKRSPCAVVPPPWHEDDCAGCNSYIKCAKQDDSFDSEAICWNCFWHGYWDDCNVKVILATHQDPEERYSLCPRCGNDAEAVD